MLQQSLAWLEWYRAVGVDAALDEAPVDWLARGDEAPGVAFSWPSNEGSAPSSAGPQIPSAPVMVPRPQVQAPARPQVPPPHKSAPMIEARGRPQTPLNASEAESEGRRLARQAATLGELEAALGAFDGCGLKATAKTLCFYRGAAHARTMIIGEAPGRDEDIEGRPFVGRAGKLLDRMLGAIGLAEGDVHITNIVYWRPPGNRTPTPQEALACRPFLERQMELVAPEVIVVAGGAAAKEVFATSDGIMRLRGKWREIEIGGRRVPAIATLHPAYLLRTPAAKQLVWMDLLQLKSKLVNPR